jgi:hypothetical protein
MVEVCYHKTTPSLDKSENFISLRKSHKTFQFLCIEKPSQPSPRFVYVVIDLLFQREWGQFTVITPFSAHLTPALSLDPIQTQINGESIKAHLENIFRALRGLRAFNQKIFL